MQSNPSPAVVTDPLEVSATPECPAPAPREFGMHFTSTPRGARLARHLVSHRLHEWGHPYDTPANETVALITAELTANAVTHGRVPGRDFHVRLSLAPGTIRVEVSDTCTERHPRRDPVSAPPDAESGRGLLLVDALASRWDITPRRGAPGKTVWAEVDCTPVVT